MSAIRQKTGLGLAVMVLALAAAAAPEEEYGRKAAELAKLKARIGAISQTMEQDKTRESEMRQAIEAAERKIAVAATEVRRLAAAVQAQDAKLRQAQAQRDAAQQNLAAQQAALSRQLRAAYMTASGGGGSAELLLGQDDPARLDRWLEYYDALNRARASLIEDVSRQARQVEELEERYQAQLDADRALQESRRQALAALEADRAERTAAMQKVSERIAGESAQLNDLQASQKQLEVLLDQLREALSDVPVDAGGGRPFPEMHGHLVWPVKGKVLARYGEAKAGGQLQWKGLWIAAADGAPVRAAAHGRVAYVGWLSSYGLIVVLQHDKGYFTLYGHNSSVSRSAGEWVNAGEVIAAAGNTGGYEQPGLYFELRNGAEAIDPKGWMAHD
jgi:septal ring factor EnvC (AmiA/AmiB activator)